MKYLIYIPVIILALAAGGCTKFLDVNENPNVPTDVKEALILSPVELNISHLVSAGFDFAVVNHWMQNVCLNQPVPNTGTYLLYSQDMDGDWSNLYSTCLNNLEVLIAKADKNSNNKHAGIARVLKAYTFSIAADLWGDIPYSGAFQGATNFKPAYDKQEDVYKGMQALLDKAIANLNATGGVTPGADDFFYGGDIAKWKKLAYTLKARLYMHLTKAPGYTAATQADLALTALQNGMQDNTDDLAFAYPGSAGQENPVFNTFHPVSTLILSEHLVEGFKTRNDPRLSIMVKPSANTGLYTGKAIGNPNQGNLEDFSRPGDFYGSADAKFYIFNYTEALFLKAEATLIKSGFAAAAPIYQAAVKAHMDKLGVSTASANSYMAARALTSGNALNNIIEEKGIANYLSIENFADWRRTGYPVLVKVPNALSEIPRRFLYPQVEIISNPQSIQAAKLTDRVWWDKP